MIPRHPDTQASSAEDHQELPGLRDGGEPSLLILADMSGQLHCLGGEGTRILWAFFKDATVTLTAH